MISSRIKRIKIAEQDDLCELCEERQAEDVIYKFPPRYGSEDLDDMVAICDQCYWRLHND